MVISIACTGIAVIYERNSRVCKYDIFSRTVVGNSFVRVWKDYLQKHRGMPPKLQRKLLLHPLLYFGLFLKSLYSYLAQLCVPDGKPCMISDIHAAFIYFFVKKCVINFTYHTDSTTDY